MKTRNLVLLFLAPAVLLVGCVIYIGWHSKALLKENAKNMVYWDDEVEDDIILRDSNKDVMEDIFNDNSIVVLGSSELHVKNDLTFPTALHQDSEYQVVMMGEHYCQSLYETISVGALSDILPNQKVVFIVSSQWFEDSILPDSFAGEFRISTWKNFLQNEDISDDTKAKINEQVQTLLSTEPDLQTTADDMYKKYTGQNLDLESRVHLWLKETFSEYQADYKLAKVSKKMNGASGTGEKAIDYDALIAKTDELGKENVHNELGMYDSYYEEYAGSRWYIDSKDRFKDKKKYESREFADFERFLTLCNDLGIECLIVSVPAQGKAWDYQGMSKDAREEYYQSIRDICKKYDVELADFSDMEYEPYFFIDTMHLGYKGWAYVDRAIYEFYKE